jgi:hypothetical protein
MATTDELLDTLIQNCKKPGSLTGENGLLKQLSRLSPECVHQSIVTTSLGTLPQEKQK